jgi:hypothetical protein
MQRCNNARIQSPARTVLQVAGVETGKETGASGVPIIFFRSYVSDTLPSGGSANKSPEGVEYQAKVLAACWLGQGGPCSHRCVLLCLCQSPSHTYAWPRPPRVKKTPTKPSRLETSTRARAPGGGVKRCARARNLSTTWREALAACKPPISLTNLL